jgi:predicted ATPase
VGMRPRPNISRHSFKARPASSSFVPAAPARKIIAARRAWTPRLPIYEEPSRQVVKEQLYIGGDALPWGNATQFVELTISRSIHHMVTTASSDRLSFLDRGIIDQVSGLEHLGLPIPEHLAAGVGRFRYQEKAFMMPPWPEIFSNDDERKHSLEDALSSYATLLRTYERFGYRIVLVPKLEVSARADFVLDQLGESREFRQHNPSIAF